MRKILQSFHKLTVKYCCKYFARDPLDFGKVNWQGPPPPHTHLSATIDKSACSADPKTQHTNTQTEIYINKSLS